MLAQYRPRTDQEAADFQRILPLLQAGNAWSRSTPLHLTGSALIVHRPSRRVLLRWHARQQAWLQVGGHADPGESDSLTIALREGREETGLQDLVAWPDGSIVHIVIVPVPAARHEGAHEHADVRFVLATEQPETARPESPNAKLRWLSLDEARALNTEANLRETLDRLERLLDER
jgi:8-oxo-dGTP pyrophosphatase MutT (NUDIX family)